MKHVFIALLLLLSQVAGAQSYWTLPTEVRGNSEFTGNITFPATGLLFKTNGTLIKSGTGALTLATGADSSTITKSGTGGLTLATGANAVSMTWGAASALTMPTGTVTVAALQTAQTFTAAQSFGVRATFVAGGSTAAASIFHSASNKIFVNGGSAGGVLGDDVGNGIITWDATTTAINKPLTLTGGFATQTISGAVTWSGAQTFNAGATIASGQTLTLTSATVAGAPTWSSTQTLNTSGNAGTATTLATARNLWGVSFNGSADLTAQPSFANGIKVTGGTAATETIARTAADTLNINNGAIVTTATAATINVPVTVNGAAISSSAFTMGAFASTGNPGIVLGSGSTRYGVIGASSTQVFRVLKADASAAFVEVSTAGAVTLGPSAGGVSHTVWGSKADTSGSLTLKTAAAITTAGVFNAIGVQGRLTSGDDSQIGSFKNGSLNPTGFLYLRTEDNIGAVFWVDNSAQFRISNTFSHIGSTSGTVVGTQTSDERLKENIRTTSYGLSTILALDPIEFDKDGKHYTGFGAQRTQPILPEAVYDTDIQSFGEGEPTQLGMDYTQIIAPLVKAVQELSVKLDAAEARVNCLANADTKEQRLACF